MRILIVDKEFPPNPHGGIGSYNFSLANTLSKRGHHISVLSCTSDSFKIFTNEPFGNLYRISHNPIRGLVGKYFYFLDSMQYARNLLPELKQIIHEESIELVEFPSAEGYGYLSAQSIKGVPIITRFHGSLGKIPIDNNAKFAYLQELKLAKKSAIKITLASQLKQPLWWMERELIHNSDLVTFPSTYSQTWLYSQMKKDLKESVVIPNGIDMEDISKHNLRFGSLKKKNKTIFFIGRCTLPKGASVLIRALPGILQSNLDAQVVFAGPALDISINDEINRLKKVFPGRIQQTGRLARDELIELFSSSYMLVHPTFFEISPMAVIESLALGIPVVASRTGPIPEIITEGVEGYLFTVGNAESLEKAINKMLSLKNADHDSMRQACIQKAKSKFDLNQLCQNLERVYSSLVR
jgi:glycosyltransferase involved in cell wall biosynthesis